MLMSEPLSHALGPAAPSRLPLHSLASDSAAWALALWRHHAGHVAEWSDDLGAAGLLRTAGRDQGRAQVQMVDLGGHGTRVNICQLEQLLPQVPGWWKSAWREALLLQALAPVLASLQRAGVRGGPWRMQWVDPGPLSHFAWPLALERADGTVPLTLHWPSLQAAQAACDGLLQKAARASRAGGAEGATVASNGDVGSVQLRPVLARLSLNAHEQSALRTGGGLLLPQPEQNGCTLAVELPGGWCRLGHLAVQGRARHAMALQGAVGELAVDLYDADARLDTLCAGPDEVLVLGAAWQLTRAALLGLQPGSKLPMTEGPLRICDSQGHQGQATLIDWQGGALAHLTDWTR